MRIAVAGATGRIGCLTVEALERMGHEIVGISRTQDADACTGEGLLPARIAPRPSMTGSPARG